MFFKTTLIQDNVYQAKAKAGTSGNDQIDRSEHAIPPVYVVKCEPAGSTGEHTDVLRVIPPRGHEDVSSRIQKSWQLPSGIHFFSLCGSKVKKPSPKLSSEDFG